MWPMAAYPSDMAAGSAEQIEEERRVLGVAMTQAKFHLHLIQPLRFFRSQQHRYGDSYVFAPRSRFIPVNILDRFECRVWPVDIVEGAKARGASARANVAARMREMWVMDQYRAGIFSLNGSSSA
jgi:ATP-dependent DNA helicase UvrD/PcrA